MKLKKKVKARLLSMDELQARPCEVDGRPALFHRWVDKSQMVSIGSRRHTIEVIRNTFALVEYRDGTVAKVEPERIRFVGEA